jgi:hypothetical protein
MPLIGPIPEGRAVLLSPVRSTLFGASRLSRNDSDIAKCVVCLQIMYERDSTKAAIYKLIHRPEDA